MLNVCGGCQGMPGLSGRCVDVSGAGSISLVQLAELVTHGQHVQQVATRQPFFHYELALQHASGTGRQPPVADGQNIHLLLSICHRVS